MAIIGTIIVYIIMACMVAAAAASIIKPGCELGNQFEEGINSIGPIFLSVAGIFAAIPYISSFIMGVFGPLFNSIGADPAMAATTIIAVDMGGYQLADVIAQTRESWIMAMYNGYMAGATVIFTVPVGLKLIDKKDHKIFAMGIMCGFLSIPIGVLVSSIVTALTNPFIRETISTSTEATYQLAMSFGQIFINILPLVVICVLIAVGLMVIPNIMIKGFSIFGGFMDIAARIILVGWILEIFTGLPSKILGGWGFDPIMADEVSLERSLEIIGYVCMMLAGAFPMVYLIQKYLSKGLGKIGKVFNLSPEATTGILATCANSIAMFPMLKDMKNEDKVKTVAFAVCGSFVIGDHLSFMANFQPNLIVPLFVGKLIAAACAVILAQLIAVPKIKASKVADA